MEPGEDKGGGSKGVEEGGTRRIETGGKGGRKEGTEVLSQYQQDFLPPLLPNRRRRPALPQPDNMAINPALRQVGLRVPGNNACNGMYMQM